MKKYIKFTVNTPLTHSNEVREAIGRSGGGRVGRYSYCTFSIKGVGRCVPLEGSNPWQGSEGLQEEIDEEQIESFCDPHIFESVICAIKKVHPYEEPAISSWTIEIN